MSNSEFVIDLSKEIIEVKFEISRIINKLQKYTGGSRERSLAITKLQECKMWLEADLGKDK